MLSLDRTACRIVEGPRVAPLSPTEFIIMDKLVKAAGYFVPDEVLIASVWRNADREPIDARKNISVHVVHLRRKMRDIHTEDIIECRWRMGYRLVHIPRVEA